MRRTPIVATPPLLRLVLLVCLAAVMVVAGSVAAVAFTRGRAPSATLGPTATSPAMPASSTATPMPSPTIAPLALDGSNPVTASADWWAWTLIDRRTGQTWGSPNETEVNRSASMTKAWLAALYLREHPDPGQAWLDRLSVMIRDSNNNAADVVHLALGGDTPVADAMVALCGVPGVRMTGHGVQSTPGRGWAWAQISPHQSAFLGACIADHRVASPRWTDWLLDEMRQVRGAGDFGVRQALHEAQRSSVAVKNGWSANGSGWVVNCLAIADDWVLAVESRSASFTTGARVCEAVTEQLLQSDPES